MTILEGFPVGTNTEPLKHNPPELPAGAYATRIRLYSSSHPLVAL